MIVEPILITDWSGYSWTHSRIHSLKLLFFSFVWRPRTALNNTVYARTQSKKIWSKVSNSSPHTGHWGSIHWMYFEIFDWIAKTPWRHRQINVIISWRRFWIFNGFLNTIPTSSSILFVIEGLDLCMSLCTNFMLNFPNGAKIHMRESFPYLLEKLMWILMVALAMLGWNICWIKSGCHDLEVGSISVGNGFEKHLDFCEEIWSGDCLS